MEKSIFRRTTFVVPDAEATAKFYEEVFGWTRWYDNELPVDARFPPAAPDGAIAHLVILQADDPQVGMLGLMQYLDPPFDTDVPTNRSKVRMGETILVIQSPDVDGVCRRARERGATIVTEPVDWQVPSHDGSSHIGLRITSFFDPWGRYMEVMHHRH